MGQPEGDRPDQRTGRRSDWEPNSDSDTDTGTGTNSDTGTNSLANSYIKTDSCTKTDCYTNAASSAAVIHHECLLKILASSHSKSI